MDRHRIDNGAVVWWLRIVAAFVVATLIVGGATRITDSGLSIVEWAPIVGVIPPLTDAAWQAALEAYRQIPEYQLVNRGMSMGEFQFIYWWEWAHRALARTIGLVFVVPFAVFWLRGMLPGWFKPWGLLLLALGGLQGFVGWWMVSSGLSDRVDVSQYRLATHLCLACVILMLTVALSVRLAGTAGRAAFAPRAVRVGALLLPLLLLVQVGLGALVAGIDAGLASDTWPLMMGEVVPPGLLALEPAWLNFFENPLTVQFTHRLTGYVVVAFALWHIVSAWRAGAERGTAAALLVLLSAQVVSGVGVVVWQVPATLAAVHQAVAAVTLWVAVAHAMHIAGPVRVGAPLPATRLSGGRAA
jgi:cytochrome c oxidase assembly protein subunit 15